MKNLLFLIFVCCFPFSILFCQFPPQFKETAIYEIPFAKVFVGQITNESGHILEVSIDNQEIELPVGAQQTINFPLGLVMQKEGHYNLEHVIKVNSINKPGAYRKITIIGLRINYADGLFSVIIKSQDTKGKIAQTDPATFVNPRMMPFYLDITFKGAHLQDTELSLSIKK